MKQLLAVLLAAAFAATTYSAVAQDKMEKSQKMEKKMEKKKPAKKAKKAKKTEADKK